MPFKCEFIIIISTHWHKSTGVCVLRLNSRSRTAFFDLVTSLDALQAGFERVHANGGCAGGDGITVGMFAFGLEKRLLRLQSALRDGSYEPRPIAVFEIEKPGKPEKRILRVPSVVDRVAQTASSMRLQDLLEPHFEEHSYAYRPGRSVKQALEAVKRFHSQGFRHIVDADIKAYFDNVPHTPLLAKLSHHVPERPFLDLVRKWLQLSAHPEKGLPQGAPISPVLANLYLDQLDEDIVEAGFRMVRYADDFVVLSKSRDRAQAALRLLSAKLEPLGLWLHPEKTVIRGLDEGYSFLGASIRGSGLGAQVEELGELPDVEQPLVMDDLDGSLSVPGSRLLQGVEVETSGPSPMAVSSLDQPWKAEANEGAAGAVENDEYKAEAAVAHRYAPYVRTLYLRERGRELVARQAGFAVQESGREIALFPPGTVDRIDIYPGAVAGDDALRHAALNGVPVFLVNGAGAQQAVVHSADLRRGKLHLAQARHALDKSLCLDIARRFVGGRMENERRLLLRLLGRAGLAKNKPDTFADGLDKLEALVRRARSYPRYESLDQLRGDEASAARIYWPLLAQMPKRGFADGSFRRTRQPPHTPFNAVLNYTSALLRRDIETLCLKHGLHTGFGHLHATDDAESALVHDLMEEFRAPVAEALAVQVLSTGEIGHDHFEMLTLGGETVAHIAEGGSTRIIRAYERHVGHVVSLDGGKSTWRGAMNRQVERYIAHVSDAEPYEPYRLDI